MIFHSDGLAARANSDARDSGSDSVTVRLGVMIVAWIIVELTFATIKVVESSRCCAGVS